MTWEEFKSKLRSEFNTRVLTSIDDIIFIGKTNEFYFTDIGDVHCGIETIVMNCSYEDMLELARIFAGNIRNGL